MALTENKPLTHLRGENGQIPLAAVKVYEGSMLGDASGYGRPLVAGDRFRGHSIEYYDNTAGSPGDWNIEHLRGRYCLEVTLTGVARTDVGKEVYASADDTLTLSPGGNSRVGIVDSYITTDTAGVEFQTAEMGAEDQAVEDVVGGSGGIAALDLVYVSDQTAGIMTVLKAQGTAGGRFADYLCPLAIAAAAKGRAVKVFLRQGIDTIAGSVGDPVYLSDATAGGYVLTKPTLTDKVQIVGRIVESHATTGAILFDLSGSQQVEHDHSSAAEGGSTLGAHGSGTITLADAANVVVNTTTGTKIATAAGQKLGFWNATPVTQPAHVADPASAAALTQHALTDNGGGTADQTVDSMAAPVTITDSTGLHSSSDDTIADGQKLVGSLGGTADGSFEIVGATNGGDVSGAIMNNFQEARAALTVLTQNDSDLGQKLIEIVTWMTAVQNNMKEVTTELALVKTDVAAVRAGSEANNTVLDSVLAQLATTGMQAVS